MKGLTEGRIVHYSCGLVHRAAIVVKVISKNSGLVELNVFWSADQIRSDTPRVMFSENPNEAGTWHWIEKEQ